MEMALHSLHLQFPDQYSTSVKIPQSEIFFNHPLVSDVSGEIIDMAYPLIHKSGSIAYSFAEGYVQQLGKALDVPLRLQVNRPHIYLTDEEKKKFEDSKPYWLVICSHKKDFTTKALSAHHLQQFVDHFITRGIRFIQPIKISDPHIPLQNVKTVSKLNIRDMFSLMHNARGCIGPITSWQHIAAAFSKPYVAIAGGRENNPWQSGYPLQHTLHTIGGNLDCCAERGCWKSRVIPLKDGDDKDKSLCKYPTFFYNQWLGRCIVSITGEEIIKVMERLI